MEEAVLASQDILFLAPFGGNVFHVFPRVYRAEGTERSLWPRRWPGRAWPPGSVPISTSEQRPSARPGALLLEETVHSGEGRVPGRPESRGGELTRHGNQGPADMGLLGSGGSGCLRPEPLPAPGPPCRAWSPSCTSTRFPVVILLARAVAVSPVSLPVGSRAPFLAGRWVCCCLCFLVQLLPPGHLRMGRSSGGKAGPSPGPGAG